MASWHSLGKRGEGLSIYLPTLNYAVDSGYLADVLFAWQTRWEEFLGRMTGETQGPQALALGAPNISTGGGTTYTFTVTYTDNGAVKVSTMDGSDIRVTGSDGFSQLATFAEANVTANGTPLTGTYRINAPGGTWDAGWNGSYTVWLEPNQVTDTNGNVATAGTLGAFQVSIGTSVHLRNL